MIGPKEDLIKFVRETIYILAPGGEYLLGSQNNFGSSFKPENIITMIETAKNYKPKNF